MARTIAVILAFLPAAPRLVAAQVPGAAQVAAPAEALPAAAEAGPETPARPPAVTETPAAEPGRLATVRLRSGAVLRGRVLSRDDRELVLETEDGVRSAIPAASIAELREAAADATQAPWEVDPNRTRYLYGPSGFMLPQGEASLSQTELLLTTFAYGVTDWLTIGGGAAVPAWFVHDGFNLATLVKVGGALAPSVHVAGTVQTFLLPGSDASAASLAFATATFGGPDLHLGLSGGVPLVWGDGDDAAGGPVFALGGVARMSRRTALVWETWLVPRSETYAATGLALRFIGDRLGVDAGFAFVGVGIPLPWLDFTWHY